ncbi:MAG: FAD-dependent oxidoreductase [Desulfarculaceae bacterium]|nr:FAD-dependent oxidoreductase [Desulfarculaceae bacterium]MCF8072163.1 FAD-dependent oxidoreductase [Desulfarculaceae bacterium]MCF8100084.1 FAD-dependent oxidoreductase [Desulfarculaceae bacterium]MCF8117941.1 FAD-dependent oxidoreductase [Desulfarculaceae bacterium]
MPAYAKLFSPLKVGGRELPNRVIMPSMGSNLADSQGRVTPAMIAYYRARAAGGPGLLVVEAACVHPSGKVIDRNFMAHEDELLEGMSALAAAIKEQGATAILQLIHGGRNAHPRLVGEALAPSALRGPTSHATPRAMTIIEIEAMVQAFARAAWRAMAAGFDGVEVHAAHEYLVHEFLTPYANKRQDAYGGDLAHRARFALEVARAVRGAIGPQAILSFRLSGDDHVAGGMGPAEAAESAKLLEQAGVDLISVTGGVYETPHMVVPPIPMPAGTHLDAAREVKKAVSIPVAGVGRIKSGAEAEAALEGLDLVAVGRAFIADPDWLKRAAKGDEGHTRPCIGCNQGCIDKVLAGAPLSCVANPWAGLEEQLEQLAPADNPATVAVVGAGLGGLEAARTLGSLGHKVVLFEACAEIGGQVRLASLPPGKGEFLGLVDYYKNALAELDNVDLRLNQKATVKTVCEVHPNAVLIATGSDPMLPDLPGVSEAPLITARQVLAGTAEVGQKVAVLGGGNLGSEVAHFLAERGHEVCIIELGLGIGNDLGPARRYYLRRELGKYKVRRYVRAKVRRLFKDKVSFLHTRPDGTRELTYVEPLDTFVSAMGAKPVEKIFLALEPKVTAIYLAGDALSPAGMGQATSEGARVALSIHRLAVEGKLAPPAAPTC